MIPTNKAPKTDQDYIDLKNNVNLKTVSLKVFL
jgi:hypothetical protein